ncbi:sugar ABC transporter substrate-binding protein [Microbacterium sp. K24]|uniref:ABC transporter substrate-binding protein n=1 Tax=Microbacterium sp. K24 TaxID=2305446 RepID=UPI0014443A4A|nr:sugar ABC transporter substrate-binding protein [Microbacterium sp. K24]
MSAATPARSRAPRLAVRVGAGLTGLTIAAAGMTACAPSGSTGDGGSGTTINVLAEDISYTDNWKELLPEFEEQTGIKVNIETVPYSDQAAKILLNFSQKSSDYDVVFTDNTYGTGYFESGYVDDLAKYEKDGSDFVAFDDFYQPYIAPMQKDGATFGLPVYGESTWLMYRTDLFEQYGIDGPPTTMDELEAAAKTISEGSGGEVAGITLRGAPGIQSVYPWAGFLRAFGGDFYDGDELAVDSEEAVEATQFWADLLSEYGPSGVGNFDWEQNRIAFTQGTAAMTIDATANGPFNEDTAASVIAGKVGYAPIPYAISDPPESGNTDNSLNVHALYLSSFSKKKEAAYKFMAWATGQDVQSNAVENTEAVGVTLDAVLESPEYNEKYGPFKEALLAQLATGNVDYLPAGTDANAIITEVGQALSRTLAGEASAKDALTAAQEALKTQLG